MVSVYFKSVFSPMTPRRLGLDGVLLRQRASPPRFGVVNQKYLIRYLSLRLPFPVLYMLGVSRQGTGLNQPPAPNGPHSLEDGCS